MVFTFEPHKGCAATASIDKIRLIALAEWCPISISASTPTLQENHDPHAGNGPRSTRSSTAGGGGRQGRPEPAAGPGPVAYRARRRPAPGATDHQACLRGRRRSGDADPVRRGDHAQPLPLRAGRQLRPRAVLALRGNGEGVLGQHRPPRHSRRQSDAALGRRPGKGRARQQGQLDRLPARPGENRRLRHQLEHRRLSRRLVGEAGAADD